MLWLPTSDQGFVINSQASATNALPKISKLAEAFDNFEVWLFMSLAHGRSLWPVASCSAFRSRASGSRAGPLLPNRSAVKYRPRKASAKWPPAGQLMPIFYWFLQVKMALPFKTYYKITNFGSGLPPRRAGRVAGRVPGAAQVTPSWPHAQLTWRPAGLTPSWPDAQLTSRPAGLTPSWPDTQPA